MPNNWSATEVLPALVFLQINGYHVPDPDGALYIAMIDISARKLDKDGLAQLFEKMAVELL